MTLRLQWCSFLEFALQPCSPHGILSGHPKIQYKYLGADINKASDNVIKNHLNPITKQAGEDLEG